MKRDPSTRLRAGSGPSKKGWARSIEPETERPLDAEDVAIASLEAMVRAEEARASLGSAEPLADLSVRLPRAMIVRLQQGAAKRSITPSELIKLALMQYLPPEKAGRRR